MDILDELAEKFAITLDSQLCATAIILKLWLCCTNLQKDYPLNSLRSLTISQADLHQRRSMQECAQA